jgi:hypothetical protein
MICQAMTAIVISSTVEESFWRDLKALAEESHQNVSGLLTEAIASYVQRRRVRLVVLGHVGVIAPGLEVVVDVLGAHEPSAVTQVEQHAGKPGGCRGGLMNERRLMSRRLSQ